MDFYFYGFIHSISMVFQGQKSPYFKGHNCGDGFHGFQRNIARGLEMTLGKFPVDGVAVGLWGKKVVI